jgi:hypothetical protein
LKKGWINIFSSAGNVAELKCALLKEQGFKVVVINKQDSTYLFGEAELYVLQDEVIRAKRILNEENA